MKGKFLFLGTGGSAGVPVIGCDCAVCKSTSTYNHRTRPSGLIQIKDKNILIDAGPDFRFQALKHGINHLTAVLLTHAHADHIAGMDDLRAYYFRSQKKLPCILSEETFDEVKVRYHYMLRPITDGMSLPAQLEFQILPDDSGQYNIEGISFNYFSFSQMQMKVTGFKFGNFAYVSDIRKYEDNLLPSLQDIEILVLSATGHNSTKMHFGIEEAIAFSKKTSAKQTYLTHISHALDHEKETRLLPNDVRLSFDGLMIPIEGIDEG